MSFNSVSRAANDPDLQQRTEACIRGEALNNEEVRDTQFAQNVRLGLVTFQQMYWAVADAVEGEYESGLLSGRGSPGHDSDVVTDDAIRAAVQANWPKNATT